MNRFDRGMEQLRKRLGDRTAGAGVSFRYYRGADSVVINNGWLGSQAFRVQDEVSSRVEWADRVFFIPVASLVINDVLIQPQRGDYIKITFPEPYGEQKFELSAPNVERPWKYVDPQGTLYQVNTKRVKLS